MCPVRTVHAERECVCSLGMMMVATGTCQPEVGAQMCSTDSREAGDPRQIRALRCSSMLLFSDSLTHLLFDASIDTVATVLGIGKAIGLSREGELAITQRVPTKVVGNRWVAGGCTRCTTDCCHRLIRSLSTTRKTLTRAC
jgi:hypothetical protein